MPVLAQEPPRRLPSSGEFVPGQILVKFKSGVGELSTQRALAAQNLTVAGAIPSLNVLYAEPNYVAYAADTIPNDTFYADKQCNLPKIDPPAAWDYTTGDSSLT